MPLRIDPNASPDENTRELVRWLLEAEARAVATEASVKRIEAKVDWIVRAIQAIGGQTPVPVAPVVPAPPPAGPRKGAKVAKAVGQALEKNAPLIQTALETWIRSMLRGGAR